MSQSRYEILGTIGVGASSRVDKARDTLIDRTVVLKTIGSGFGSPELQKEFLREAQILGRLSHPNIISIYDLGANDDGSAYLVMEYVPGKTLESALLEKGAVPLARAGVWAGDLASALARAHKAGVIHGDVKPANIFVTDESQIKLGDFGIARFATQVSGSARLVGTPAYLSPEQIKGEPQDHRSDIFSMGIVLYQMVTGVRPFDGTSVAAVCAQIVAMQPPPPSHFNPAIPPEFDRIVMRCLSKEPAARYASGESLAASLYPFARSKPVDAAPHRFNLSWFQGPLRPVEAWVCGATAALALFAIPALHSWHNSHKHSAPAGNAATSASHSIVSAVQAASLSPAPVASRSVDSSSAPDTRTPESSTSAASRKAAALPQSPLADQRSLTSKPAVAATPNSSNQQLAATAASAASPLRAAKAAPQSASLGIEITSAIAGETLAIFADQHLVATSSLSVTRPGETLHLDRPLPPGPHEFRIALYRPDNSLHLERQGLAELQSARPNTLSVHVVRHSKMLVKRDADLLVAWPSSSHGPAPLSSSPKSSAPVISSAATSTVAAR
ncbi:MAG TPA: protein kinase [Candidatus Acidoferrum sp.]|nr:protein kinase [Candidatus Acidoferrum sp.]